MSKSKSGVQSSPVSDPPSTKKSSSSMAKEKDMKNQKSILKFFQKKSTDAGSSPISNSGASSPLNDSTRSSNIPIRKPVLKKASRSGSSANLTPAPSSDAPEPPDDEIESILIANKEVEDHGLP